MGGEAGADRIVCKVSHAGGKPILFYAPGRDKVGGIPEGWREVMINGEPFQANFVKIAVNVVTRPGSSQNVLPDILCDWFGPSAGEPGTTQHVIFQRIEGGGYTLSPLGDIPVPSGPLLWQPYTRAEVADRFGLKFVGWEEQQGIVTRPGLILLFVTLDKSTMVEAHRYRDQFLSAGEFQWQSQNRTTQASTLGQDLQQHAERGIHVHLCVRVRAKANGRTVPFTYCGELVFERWEGEKPITVWWRMQEPVPVRLWGELGIK